LREDHQAKLCTLGDRDHQDGLHVVLLASFQEDCGRGKRRPLHRHVSGFRVCHTSKGKTSTREHLMLARIRERKAFARVLQRGPGEKSTLFPNSLHSNSYILHLPSAFTFIELTRIV
jgi:hypothetical protein